MRASWIVVFAGLVGCAADTSDEAPPYGRSEVGCLKLEGAWKIDADPIGDPCTTLRLHSLDFGNPTVNGKTCTLGRFAPETVDRTCTHHYLLECKSGSLTTSWDFELMPSLDAPAKVIGTMRAYTQTGITVTCDSMWDVTLTR